MSDVDMSPPWIICSDRGRPVAILPAGRPGEVANVREWDPEVAVHLVQCANAFHDALVTAKMTSLTGRIRELMAPFRAGLTGSKAP